MEISITNLENYRIEKFFNRYSNHKREKFFSNFEFLTTFFPSLFNFLVFENYANLYERMYEFATKERVCCITSAAFSSGDGERCLCARPRVSVDIRYLPRGPTMQSIISRFTRIMPIKSTVYAALGSVRGVLRGGAILIKIGRELYALAESAIF